MINLIRTLSQMNSFPEVFVSCCCFMVFFCSLVHWFVPRRFSEWAEYAAESYFGPCSPEVCSTSVARLPFIGKVQRGGPTNGSDLPRSGFLPPEGEAPPAHIGSPHTTPASGHVGRLVVRCCCCLLIQLADSQPPGAPLWPLPCIPQSRQELKGLSWPQEIPGGNMNFLPCPHLPGQLWGF